MSTVSNRSFDTHGEDDGVWGELVGVENVTGHERTFTVFMRSGSFLIVNDKGEERLAGPDDSRNRPQIAFEPAAARAWISQRTILMSEAVYFHVTLEPHHKHSGKRTGRRIGFLAEVPLDAAKAVAQSSDDEQRLFEEAKRLVAALTSIAMTGQRRQPGEDEMRSRFILYR